MKLLLPIIAALLAGGCCGRYGADRPGRPAHPVTPLVGADTLEVKRDRGPVTVPPVLPPATTNGPTGDGDLFELKTEDLTANRQTGSNGALRIRKYIVTETRSLPVSLRREEAVIERVPASGPTTAPFWEGETVLELPLTVETVTPVVTPRVYETLRIKRTVETDSRTVEGVLRTEKVDVDRVRSGGP